ncbi:MAG: cytochrome c3 family protein [Syntrophobacteria bacterium]
MGKRLLTVLAVAAFMSGAVFLSLSGAADVPDVITLEDTLWSEHTKSPVTFFHKKHSEEYSIACDECHHVYKDGENVWKEGDPVQKCHECHTEPTVTGERRLSEEQQKLNLKLAFHNNCMGCHRELKMQDREKYKDIPTMCSQCHPMEKK